MGFWKKLGKIASIAAPIAAAPFTGGATLALIGAGSGAASGALNGGGLKGALLGAGMGAIPGVGAAKGATGATSALSKVGGAMSKIAPALSVAGNVASAVAGGRAAGREAEAERNLRQDTLRLQGAKFNLDAPQSRARNSVRGDLLANMQPVQISGPITGTKGKMPTISGGLTPSVLSDNSRQLGQLMSREALLSQMQGPAFTPTPLPQANAFDKILNGVGYAGLAAQGLGAMQMPKPQPSYPGTPPFVEPISPKVGVRF